MKTLSLAVIATLSILTTVTFARPCPSVSNNFLNKIGEILGSVPALENKGSISTSNVTVTEKILQQKCSYHAYRYGFYG